MSTIAAKRKNISGFNSHTDLVEWKDVKRGDDGAPIEGVVDSIQVEGVFGVKGCVAIEGSNDGEHFRILRDRLNGPLHIYSPLLITLVDRPRFVRPHVIDGDDTTSLNVTGLVRR